MLDLTLSTEMLLLIILCALTLIAFMIAINSHGAARMSLSYLLATVLLAITIIAVLQQVNTTVAQQQEELFEEKATQEEQAATGAETPQASIQVQAKDLASKQALSSLIGKGSTLSSRLRGVQLQGYGISYEELTAKSDAALQEVSNAKRSYTSARSTFTSFPEAVTLLNSAYANLEKAGRYYTLYYRSDDNEQEVLREKIIRSSAAEAELLFKQAEQAINKQN